MERRTHNNLNESIKNVFLGDTPDDASHDRTPMPPSNNASDIVDSFVNEILDGVDLNEHTEEELDNILSEAIIDVFDLCGALNETLEEK